MSDWNRSGREDDQRRYGYDQRRQMNARDRWADDDQRRREQRSFDDRSRDESRGDRYGEYGAQRYGGQDSSARQDYRALGYRGASQEYVSGYDYGVQGYGGEGYGGQSFPSRSYGDQRYDARRYGDQQYRTRQGGQSDFVGYNEELRRVTEGEGEHGMWSHWGRGEHRGRGPKNYTRSDERIREDVNDRLSDDAWLDASEIDVKVSGCEVTLSGTVNQREDRRRAEDLAEHVSGVKHVQNNLRVEPRQAASATTTATATAPSTSSTPRSSLS